MRAVGKVMKTMLNSVTNSGKSQIRCRSSNDAEDAKAVDYWSSMNTTGQAATNDLGDVRRGRFAHDSPPA